MHVVGDIASIPCLVIQANLSKRIHQMTDVNVAILVSDATENIPINFLLTASLDGVSGNLT